MDASPILVIGATGKVGRRVVGHLAAAGHAVRPAGRQTPLAFSWDDRSNWADHFAGVSTAYASYYPDMAAPGAEADIAALVEVARAAGLQRLVLLSGRGESGAERCESILVRSGLGYTLVRAAFFNQNFSEGLMHPGVMSGLLALPAGQRREPFVDVEDIAEVAAAALIDERHHNQLYDLTGPHLLTFAEAAARIAAASGRAVGYQPIDLDTFHAAMAVALGPDAADLYTELFREVFDGRNEVLGDGVARALGRPARDFSGFCRDAAAAGVWREAA